MGTINRQRLLLGGLVGGIAAFIVDGILNGVLFKGIWEAGVTQGLYRGASAGTLTAEFIIVAVTALLGTYLYALARTQLGASPKSGATVAATVGLMNAVFCGGGMMVWSTAPAVAGSAMVACSFVIPAVGTFVGAWVYRE